MAQTVRVVAAVVLASLVTLAAVALLGVPVLAQAPRHVICMSVEGSSGGFAAIWMNQQLSAGKSTFFEVSTVKLLCAW